MRASLSCGAAAIALAVLCSPSLALAGTEPLYQPAPDWADIAQIAGGQRADGKRIVVLDTQERLENEKLWIYNDVAFRVDSPDALTSGGTLSAQWLPDKGDLIVHRVEIIRENETVDVLAGGAQFTVLRREQQLERRLLDGNLTATMAVPGLRIGDIVRLSYTTVQADQALGDDVQAVELLPRKPLDAEMVRLVMSWPKGDDVSWAVGPGLDTTQTTVKDGYHFLEVALPLDEAESLPGDVPWRFRRPPMIQVTTYASWADVSRSIAAHFSTAGTIAPDGPIAQQVAEIVAASDDPLRRAAMALRKVQDEISYLLNGMDGGNYLPQSPAETWEVRYGDCKAKSLLLLAMLREMGIEAEAVLVHSSMGDALPELLPMPADFDHVIVHATIAGVDYWLDGTAAGTRLSNIGDVPPFHYGLPLRKSGAELVQLEQRAKLVADRSVTLSLDQSAGVDLPGLFDIEVVLNGALAGTVRSVALQSAPKGQKYFVEALLGQLIGPLWLLDQDVQYDDENGTATVTANGITPTRWSFERGRARQDVPALSATGFSFTPDRAKPSLRGLPVAIQSSVFFKTDVSIALPDDGVGYELKGREVVDSVIANVSIRRAAAIEGGRLTVNEAASSILSEIPPELVAAEKAKSARFVAGNLSLRSPRDVIRRWDYTTPDARKKLAPLERAFTALIASDEEPEASTYLARGAFRFNVLDRDGALEDYGKALELEPTVQSYLARSRIYAQMGEEKKALADVRSAFEIDPSPNNALEEAYALAEMDRFDEALELVEIYEDDFESYEDVMLTKAQLLAMSGAADEGLAVIEELLVERPGEPGVLNSLCWHKGAWQVHLDSALEQCVKAVEGANWSPPVLDSRAMTYFRLGRYQEALDDLNAALASAPGLAPTLFMRGIVRHAAGDANWREDIDQALRMNPSIAKSYGRYGIKVAGG